MCTAESDRTFIYDFSNSSAVQILQDFVQSVIAKTES